MARTPRDLSDITGILMGGRDFSSSLRGSWVGLRIGFVDPNIWQPTWFVDPHEVFKNQTVSRVSFYMPLTELIGRMPRPRKRKEKFGEPGDELSTTYR
jgi:hypothetical protein